VGQKHSRLIFPCHFEGKMRQYLQELDGLIMTSPLVGCSKSWSKLWGWKALNWGWNWNRSFQVSQGSQMLLFAGHNTTSKKKPKRQMDSERLTWQASDANRRTRTGISFYMWFLEGFSLDNYYRNAIINFDWVVPSSPYIFCFQSSNGQIVERTLMKWR
jgi:hypothetical protein